MIEVTTQQAAERIEAAIDGVNCDWGDKKSWTRLTGDQGEGEFVAACSPAALELLLAERRELLARQETPPPHAFYVNADATAVRRFPLRGFCRARFVLPSGETTAHSDVIEAVLEYGEKCRAYGTGKAGALKALDGVKEALLARHVPCEPSAVSDAFEAELDRLEWDSDSGGAVEAAKVYAAFNAVSSSLAVQMHGEFVGYLTNDARYQPISTVCDFGGDFDAWHRVARASGWRPLIATPDVHLNKLNKQTP